MKKANLFFLITMIVIGCVLSGCAGNDNVEIVKVINSAESTKEESVQDVPDAEQYGKIILVSKEDERTLYYYEREGKYYIEDPYVGIYQCEQDLNSYFKSIADI